MSVKVTMNLTQRDVRNTEEISDMMHSRSKAQVVSTALSVTKLIAEKMSAGNEVLIRKKDGSLERIIIPDLS
ncbi:hypothetical protein [Gluconobacter oxydans]|uniref:hypothetical protein n=1 Tax=Gluconobacter oxydans TaxID=442 RepID=UPI0039E7E87E